MDEWIEVARTLPDQSGQTVDRLAQDRPLLVVFLRHAGCPFCREALDELSSRREAIESAGTRIALVHMMSDAEAAELFARYGLQDVPRISDPEQRLYRAFGLRRGGASQVMGPRIWWQGFKTTILSGHLPGKPVGDIYQLPGAFLVFRGRIVRAFRPDNSAERPDYEDLAVCPTSFAEDTTSTDE